MTYLRIILTTAFCVCLLACSTEFSSDHTAGPSPWTDKPFNNTPENFQFAIVGDRTGGARLGVFERAMTQINWLQPEFVISVGDLIEGYSEDLEVLEKEWNHVDSMVGSLDMPFFYVVGNHDMGNNIMRDVWQARYGKRDYYHFIYKNVLFLAVNTEDPPTPLDPEMQAGIAYFKELLKTDPEKAEAMIKQSMQDGSRGKYELPTKISDEQVAYFEQVLADNPSVRWTVVLMHKPAWVFKHPNWPRLEALLAGRPHTVIAGHQHYYQHEVRSGVDYIQMGTTGGSFHRAGPGKMDHVAWVTMTDDGPVFANIRLQGLQNKLGETGHERSY